MDDIKIRKPVGLHVITILFIINSVYNTRRPEESETPASDTRFPIPHHDNSNFRKFSELGISSLRLVCGLRRV